MLTPAAFSLRDQRAVARLVDERPNRLRDHRADLRNRPAAPRPAPRESRPSSGSVAPASRRLFRRRAGCRARKSTAQTSFALLRSICSNTLRPTLPSLRGTARSERGSLGVTTRFSSVAAVEVIEIGEVVHEILREQLIDQRRAEPLDVHRRRATRSARGCGAGAPGTTCSRSARRLLPRRAAACCRTPDTSSASPTAAASRGAG